MTNYFSHPGPWVKHVTLLWYDGRDTTGKVRTRDAIIPQRPYDERNITSSTPSDEDARLLPNIHQTFRDRNRQLTASICYRNLLTMTAMIRRTSTVMMAMVMMRFVAILSKLVLPMSRTPDVLLDKVPTGALPTRHAS